MTKDKIFKYNELCAVFLGMKNDAFLLKSLIDEKRYNIPYYTCYLQFHTDWNLIMRVKEKIVSLGFFWYQYPTIIQINENEIYSNIICEIVFDKTEEKEGVVKAIYSFLIWYNNDKKRD